MPWCWPQQARVGGTVRSWPIETAAFSFANAQPDASGRAPAGAVGSVAGQLAKADGARVVGIAGGPEKCALLTD
nr:dehydrogenase [Mycobacterium canetti]